MRPVFIPCASGYSVDQSICIAKYGDLVRIVAPDCADIAPADAAGMADVLREFAIACGYRDREVDDGK